MSMWQPWASLLVYGIKKIEGRSWDTDFRGMLWIASGVHETTQEEFSGIEQFYQERGVTEFPANYPKGALLGCVEVVDVLPQAEYRKKTDETREESGSDYLFICQSPQRLIVPVSVSGSHKIWNLSSKVVTNCLKGLTAKTGPTVTKQLVR
eukprot:TRINITY_DN8748_c0_g1_i1.p1 TRINITY_DN8748_c0_g1~~TRINITY_DN8748_c0_g1_i1.p1  ORF type:complete len:151 (+),score=21.41 TRINITY_DN8748_c0_g1_i1:466-918(+)